MSALIRTVSLALALALVPPAAGAAEKFILRCGTGVHAGEALGLVTLPSGGVFCPLFADPKAVRSFATYVHGDFPSSTNAKNVGSVGIGDGVALLRYGGPRPGEGFQVEIEAAVFSQFNLDAPSLAMLNADYVVGVPLTYRFRTFSTRLRLYHQSSHLGDELLLAADPPLQRQNLSYESLELILSQELGVLRVYAGGEWLFHRSPDTLDDLLAHLGAELRLGPASGARFVAAIDVKSSEQQEWKPAFSLRGGLEIARWSQADHPPRLFSIVAEFYDGPSPYGQFFAEDTQYYGGGFQLQL
jgi:hypothetical protein